MHVAKFRYWHTGDRQPHVDANARCITTSGHWISAMRIASGGNHQGVLVVAIGTITS
jgi:hypothetical protein